MARTTQHLDGDSVNHPDHYNSHPSGVECIEIVRHMSFNIGNVFKYLWREGIKDQSIPLEDMRKAAFYLNDEIQQRQKELSDAQKVSPKIVITFDSRRRRGPLLWWRNR